MEVTEQRKLRRQMVIRRYAPIDPPLPYSTIQPDPRNELTPPLMSRYTLIIFQPELGVEYVVLLAYGCGYEDPKFINIRLDVKFGYTVLDKCVDEGWSCDMGWGGEDLG